MKDNFDKIIADKVLRHEITPPKDMWSKIESSLDSASIAPIPLDKSGSKNKRRLLIFSVASASAIVFISLLLMTNIENNQIPHNTISIIDEIENKKNPAAIATTQICRVVTENLKKETNCTSTSVQQNSVVHLPKQLGTANHPQTNSKCDSHSLNDKKSRSGVEVIDSKDKSSTNSKEKTTTIIKRNRGIYNRGNIVANRAEKKKAKNGLLFGFNGGGNFSSSTDKDFNSDVNSFESTTFVNIDRIDPELSRSKIIEPTWRHNIPLSFSFTLLKMFNKRVGIETGLTYTYLSSQNNSIIESDNNNGYKQNSHYLGIPVSFYYKIINRGDFSLYAKCGILVDKAISSRRDKYEDNAIVESANVNSSGIQASAIVKVGASYDINKMVSLYFEPTVNYYFDSNQPISYRTENDFGFSANLGFRVRL